MAANNLTNDQIIFYGQMFVGEGTYIAGEWVKAEHYRSMESQRDHWLQIAREKDAEIERLNREIKWQSKEIDEQVTEIQRLQAENAELTRCLDGGVDCAREKLELRAALTQYAGESWLRDPAGLKRSSTDEPSADALDAARYRWIRKSESQIAGPAAYTPYTDHQPLFEDALDSAVDAAIACESQERTNCNPEKSND